MMASNALKSFCRSKMDVIQKKRSIRLSLIIVLFVALCLLLLMMIFPVRHPLPTSHPISSPDDFSAPRSSGLMDMPDTEMPGPRTTLQTPADAHLLSVAQSKQWLMRQNAPTRLFSAGHDAINNRSSGLPHHDYSIHAIQHPGYTIFQGEMIHATLETAIHSGLPGMVRAIVSEPVYAYTTNRVLIPAGSRLIGHYSSKTLPAVNRLMVIWSRVIFPDGQSIQLDSAGADPLGRVGLTADDVDRHFLYQFGQATLLSLLGVAAGGGEGADTQPLYQQNIERAFQASTESSLGHMHSIPPTLYIHQGAMIVVFVAHDLDCSPSSLATR